jgi:hypothetical protein
LCVLGDTIQFCFGNYFGEFPLRAAPAPEAKMIRLQKYAAFSLLATASAAYYAFSSRDQFYPAMVYLSTSKICFVLLNTGLQDLLRAAPQHGLLHDFPAHHRLPLPVQLAQVARSEARGVSCHLLL